MNLAETPPWSYPSPRRTPFSVRLSRSLSPSSAWEACRPGSLVRSLVSWSQQGTLSAHCNILWTFVLMVWDSTLCCTCLSPRTIGPRYVMVKTMFSLHQFASHCRALNTVGPGRMHSAELWVSVFPVSLSRALLLGVMKEKPIAHAIGMWITVKQLFLAWERCAGIGSLTDLFGVYSHFLGCPTMSWIKSLKKKKSFDWH